MPGPAPKKTVRRTNARPDWRTLPRSGRSGPAPDWPLGKASRKATALWDQLWATPQAAAWEELGWTRVVARYAQVILVCEGDDVTAAMLAEARQIEDRLGLSPMAMRRLQWDIESAVEATPEAEGVTNLDDYRDAI